MPTAHQASLYANVQPSRVFKLRTITPDFPLTNVATDYESINPGIRYNAALSFVSGGPMLADGTSALDGVTANLSVSGAQTTLAEVKNYYLQWRNPFSAYMLNANGQHFNFTKEAGTLAVPTGAQLMGGSWEWNINDEKRSLDLNATTYLTDLEFEWLLGAAGTAGTFGTGGTALGLTNVETTAPANFRRAGFKASGLTINGVVVGVLEKGANSITIRSASEAPDDKGRPVNTFVETEARFAMRQTKSLDMLAALTDRQQQYTIIASTMAGETFKWTTGASAVDFAINVDDTKSGIELSLKSRHPVITGTGSIDWGVGTATQVEFKTYAWT